jgi:hypothetical protein
MKMQACVLILALQLGQFAFGQSDAHWVASVAVGPDRGGPEAGEADRPVLRDRRLLLQRLPQRRQRPRHLQSWLPFQARSTIRPPA